MKIYLNTDVYQSGIDRIRYIFEEFPNVVVNYSGGKDSTVIFNLAMQVAREKNRLPLKVLFVDQEAEWKGTIDLVEEIMTNPDVEPYWFQMPMVITNNASSYNRYNYCWNEEDKDKWIHPQHEISIKENIFGTDRFHDLFKAIMIKLWGDQKTCNLTGVRAEESPKRMIGLVNEATYKHITWGKVEDKKREHYSFHPLYDWSYSDIWKSIHDNKWSYNRIYDEMYKHGVKINDMRISNVHHETAIQSLLLVQEIEPETWEKICNRIDGANTIKHIKLNSFRCPTELPYMFESWKEYALHLAENIIQEESNRELLYAKIKSKEEFFSAPLIVNDFWKTIVKTILSSDWDFTKLVNWETAQPVFCYRRFKNGKRNKEILMYPKYLENHEIREILENN